MQKLLGPNGGNSFKLSRCKSSCLLSGLSGLSGCLLTSSGSSSFLTTNSSSAVNGSSNGVGGSLNSLNGLLSSSLGSLLGIVGAGNHANASDNGKSQN